MEVPESLRTAISGRYQIEAEIGRGGMAAVYRARDVRHHRVVAVKVLEPGLGSVMGAERFLREIRLTARLNHPHILPLLDSGAEGEVLYYVMPYIAGESLRVRLEREVQLPVDEALRITKEIALALDHAHQLGIVHRDVKPENILLAGSDVLVADFGIARALDAAGGKLTETGMAIGTPAYMSPEQASASNRIDARADIYALGCVLYELLAGEPPFTGPTAQAVLARHSVDPVRPLRSVRGTVSLAVERAVLKALAKVPADRFSTARQFADALEGGEPATERRRRLRPMSVRTGLIAGAALVLVATAIVGTQLARNGTPLSATTIAVLPLGPTVPDSALERLGRDLVVTVSTTLDRLGELRAVDRFAILSSLPSSAWDPGNSLERAADLARRYGAGAFVLGSIAREGAAVRLDVGVYGSADRTPTGPIIVVTAPPESLAALTDSLSMALLRQVWRRGTPPTPSLASLTTRSVPALRAFLDGERAVMENRWPDAAAEYARATAADTAFLLGYQRYAEALSWMEEDVPPEVIERLRRHRDSLDERDRLMADAFVAWADDSVEAGMRHLAELLRRYPDFWPGWFMYGDRLTHFGPMRGYPASEASSALRRAAALNPHLLPAWQHILFAATGRDTALTHEAVVELSKLGFHPFRSPQYAELIQSDRQGASPERTGALLDTAAGIFAAADAGGFREGPPEFLVLFGFPSLQIGLNRRILALGVSREFTVNCLRGIATSWAARGAWDSALTAADQWALGDGSRGALGAYGMVVLGAWLEAVPPSEARRRRQAAERELAGLPANRVVFRRVYLAWLDGVLAFAEQDAAGLAAARASARASGAPVAVTTFNDRSLEAFQQALAGDSLGAGTRLAALEWSCAGSVSCGLGTYDIAIHRLAAGRWLRATDPDQAARLLLWHQAFQAGFYWTGSEITAGLAYLELARIEEARGRPALARDYYRQFLRRYDRPSPARRPLVDEAMAAATRLGT